VARLRSALAAPGSTRLAGVVVALAGAALLVFGVIALGSGTSGSSGAAPAPVTPSPTAAPPASASGSASATPSPTASTAVGTEPPPRTTVPAPPVPTRTSAARAPVTVLNNSTIHGLADRAAAAVQARGWQVAQVGNFAGRLAVTTVYYTPGDARQEAAARELAREFPQVAQVLPRYAGLPPTPAGIVMVVTKDW
jgi:LytR cell envelope-related transcriptional attenuator